MKIARDNDYEGYAIRRYDERGVTLSDGRTIGTSLLLTADDADPDWRPRRFEELGREDFEPFFRYEPQVALLGTGPRMRLPDRDILRLFASHGLSLEAMDTAAACRTFNVLVGESRRVVAGLLMV